MNHDTLALSAGAHIEALRREAESHRLARRAARAGGQARYERGTSAPRASKGASRPLARLLAALDRSRA